MISSVFFTAVAAASVSADSDGVEASGWERSEVALSYSGRGGDWEAPAIPVVYSTREDKIGVGLFCDASSYQVRFALRPLPMREALFGTQSRSIRKIRTRLYVEDEMVWDGDGLKFTALGSVMASGHTPAAKVYNAIVRGQEVSYRLGRGKVNAVDTPPVDDMFRSFVADCKDLQRS